MIGGQTDPNNILEASYNTGFTTQSGEFSVWKYRLDTSPVLENIEMFLKGTQIIAVQDPKTRKVITKERQIGVPKANEKGIRSILMKIQSLLNSAVVQGYFPEDNNGYSKQYIDYLTNIHINLVCHIINNRILWDIEITDCDEIVNFIMDLLEPFMSRCVGNKERDSYIPTMRHVESLRESVEPQEKSSWHFSNMFKRQ